MKKIFILLIILFITSCEKDDICSDDTTPKVVIEFYDIVVTDDLKSVANLKVTGDGLTTAYGTFSANTIEIPLRTTDDFTKYSFVLNSTDANNINTDFIQFNYTRSQVYVSRACGYKTVYQLNTSNPVVVSDTIPNDGKWIQQINVVNSTINNENETHIKIYF